jgi:hypothetical protein
MLLEICNSCIGCLIFVDHFPQKSLIISGSFAESDLQLEASYASLPSFMSVMATAPGVEVCVSDLQKSPVSMERDLQKRPVRPTFKLRSVCVQSVCKATRSVN